jgi:hypothetical protein
MLINENMDESEKILHHTHGQEPQSERIESSVNV